MEKWIQEAIQSNFAAELQSGRLSLKASLIQPDDQYKLRYASLIVKNLNFGKETGFVNAQNIWKLKNDEAAFKAYIVAEIKKALGQA